MLSSFRIINSISFTNASKLNDEPGNLSRAKGKVSTISLLILSFPKIFNSLFKCDKSNSAL